MRLKDKSELFQFDTNQRFVEVGDCAFVDFVIGKTVYRVKTEESDEGREVRIPDEFFQISGKKLVYECYEDGTYIEYMFIVTARAMPPDYIYTPTDHTTFDELVQQVQDEIASLERRAEAGEFDGPPGAPGAPGVPGEPGQPGEPGPAGFSPSAKVERTADGAVISITDKDGTTSAEVKDGQGGGGSDVSMSENPAGGVDLTVSGQTETLAKEEEVADVKADLSQLDGRVTTLENTPIPEETIETAVTEYLDTHGGVYVPYSNVYETINKGKLVDSLPNVVSKPNISSNTISYSSTVGISLDNNSSYDTYYFVADKKYEIYTDGLLGTYFAIVHAQNYSGTTTISGFTVLKGENPIRYRNINNNLPTIDNKLTINSGDVVAFTCNKNVVEKIYGVEIETTVKKSFSDEVVDNVIKSVYARYYNVRSQYYIEKLEIFVPSTLGYIRYDFGHSVSDSTKSDVWRIDNAYACDENFFPRYPICASGEWECALRLKDGSDFSGGAIHGDEVMDNIVFFMNGVQFDVSSLTTLTKCDEISIVQSSTLYNADNETQEIAKHGSKYIFNSNGLSIEQSIKWLGSYVLSNCYLAMFPVLKTVTDKLYSNVDFVIEDLPKYVTKKTCDSINIFKSDVGFNACFETPIYPHSKGNNGDYFLCSDNGGLAYNKCYFTITTNGDEYQTTLNELWKSTTNFKLDITL